MIDRFRAWCLACPQHSDLANNGLTGFETPLFYCPVAFPTQTLALHWCARLETRRPIGCLLDQSCPAFRGLG